MTKPITPEMIAAWRTLQEFALAVRQERAPHHMDAKAAEAIDLLDNSDWMVPIEEAGYEADNDSPRVLVAIEENGRLFQARGADNRVWSAATTYDQVTQNLAERPELFLIVTQEELRIAALHPGVWGNTTPADMARHQQAD